MGKSDDSHGKRLERAGPNVTGLHVEFEELLYALQHHSHDPEPAALIGSFIQRGESELLYETLPLLIQRLFENCPPAEIEQILERLSGILVPAYGRLAVDNLLLRMQVILGQRRMSIAFYDYALHAIGGGQKYGCTMAAALQDRFDVTFIANRPVEISDLEKWYRISLAKCRMRIVPLPYFDDSAPWFDSNLVKEGDPNPFQAVSDCSKDFDIFVNVNMLTMVRPLSPFSIFICHFPDTPRRCHFSAHEYSCTIVNSIYTARWLRLRWGMNPDFLLYPPVRMEAPPQKKENIILSAARFEMEGSKKQTELVRAFDTLCHSHPDLMRNWRLVLLGASIEGNHYLKRVKRLARNSSAQIEIRTNVPYSELQNYYARAKIFWHACGLGEDLPNLIEHFGMTTVEAMQNRCVPVVIDGGGQREIVDHGRCGYQFGTLDELMTYTLKLISDQESMGRMGAAASEKSRKFHQMHFEENVTGLFHELQREYSTAPKLEEISQNRSRTGLFRGIVARKASHESSALSSDL